MEISHSRLLKFLLSNNLDNPIMSEQQELRVEYISEPTNVESVVPGQQRLREPSDADEIQNIGETSDKAKDDDSTFVPVITTKKEEAVFTKGDLKLQKVSVSENISKNKIVNPMYSEVHCEVIKDEQPIRTVPTVAQGDENPADNKPKSRIPMLRLKTEKFKQVADETKAKKVPSRQLRRSSIPKLKKIETLSNKETEKKPIDNKHKTNGHEKTVQTSTKDSDENIVPPEVEFEKMFDEIIHNDSEPILNTNVLVDSFEDAEKLEHSFEEIMHDYEENRIQPIDVEQIKSKTPFKKQKSLPEESFARKLERRSSLKDIPFDNNNTKTNIITKDSKSFEMQTNNEKYVKYHENHEILKQKSFDDKRNTNFIHEIKQNHSEHQENQNIFYANKNKMDSKIKNEINKLDLNEKCINIAPEHNKTGEESLNQTIGKPVGEENSLQIIKTHFKNSSVEKSNTEIPKPATVKSDEIICERDRTITTKIPKLRGKVSMLANKFFSNETGAGIQYKKDPIEIQNKQSIISKIGVINKNDNESLDNFEQDNTTDSEIKKLNEKPFKGCFGENVKQNDVKEQACLKSDLRNKVLDDTSKDSDEEYLDKPSPLVAKIRRDSVEKLKFERSESMNTELSNALNIKNKFSLDSVTPPNTPQVHDYESYKDSAHSAGEPKILNIDVTNDVNKTRENEYRNNKNEKLIGPRHKGHQFDSINRYNIDVQNTDFKQLNVPQYSTTDINNQHQPKNYKDQIDFNSPNPDEFDRAPLFEAVNKKINTVTNTNKPEKEGNLIKGNVSKIITRIDSTETLGTEKNLSMVELPVKKSVSTKIAMFERQTSFPSETKPKLKLLLDAKPRIIEEVLKAQPPRRPTHETEIDAGKQEPQTEGSVDIVDNLIYCKSIKNIAKVVEIQDSPVSNVRHDILSHTPNNSTVQGDIIHLDESKNINGLTANIHEENNIYDRKKPTDHRVYSNNDLLKDNETPKRQKHEMLVFSVKEKLKTVQSNTGEGIDKPKSVAEIDLGDAVKGKVLQMIVRMNSIEKIELQKKFDNIDIRERPRKKSVSEKIALFEKKNLTQLLTNSKENHVIRVTDSATPEAQNNTETQPGTTSAPKTGTTPAPKTGTTPASKTGTTPAPKAGTTPAPKTEITTAPKTETTPVSEPASAPEPTPTPDPNHEVYKQRIEALQNAKLTYGRMEDMMYMKLKNGQDLPVLFLGTALLDPVLLPHIIGAAIDLGYRGIDTAFIYGNEKQVGQAIKAKIDDGTVKREDLFITGKLWSTFHRQDLVEKACLASLEALGLEYFDLYLIHNPMSFKEGGSPIPMIANVLQYSDTDYLQAWYGMEGLVEKGLAKGIGLSNFNSEQVAKVVSKGKIKPVVNQVECHPYLTQQRLDQFCADRQVILQCFGTLGSKATPAEYKDNPDAVIDDPMVRVMAAGLNITPAQLLLRYQIECGHSVVTKCSSADRLWDNIQAQSVSLSAAEVDALHALNRNKRTYTFKGMGDTHRNYPFRIPY